MSTPIRQTAIASFNSRLNVAYTKLYNAEVAIGLDMSGNYVPDLSGRYIASAASVKEAISAVDAQLFSVATTYAPTDYVNSSIAALVNSAPEILDTLGEISAALGNDAQLAQTLNTQISTETSRARAAEQSISTILAAEVARATAADEQFRTDLSGEILRATTAEAALASDLAAEIARATGAEQTLSTMLNTEIENRTSALSTLTAVTNATLVDLSGSLHTQLDAEVSRATGVESLLTIGLANEISRSTTIDTQLRVDLSGEILRATETEAQLRTDLSGEIVRATAAETALSDRASAIEASYIKKDGSVAFVSNLDLSGNKIVNVGLPTDDGDLSNKLYVDTKISALGTVFEYVGTIDPTVTSDLDSLEKKEPGDYYRVIAKGALTYNSGATTLNVNIGDGVIRNKTNGWDIIDNTDPTITGTAGRLTVTGNADDGYTLDIAANYVGQDTITTVGTLTTGTWSANVIGTAYGGTGKSSYSTGDILVGDANGSLTALPIGANGTVLRTLDSTIQWTVNDTSKVAVQDSTNLGSSSNAQEALDYLFNFTQIRKVAQHVVNSSTAYSDPDSINEGFTTGKVNFINYDASNTNIYLPPASAGLADGTVFRIVHNGTFENGNYIVKFKNASNEIVSVLELAPRDSIALLWSVTQSTYLFAVGI